MEHDAQLVPIDSLKPYPGNARQHDIGVIRESLRTNGQYRPLVVRRKTRHVLAGNGTLEAAREEGWASVWVTIIDCDAKKAKRIVLVDNRANDLAGYDGSRLQDLLGSLPVLEGTGFDIDALEDLRRRSGAPDDDDWTGALGALSHGAPGVHQMAFLLTAAQRDDVRRALEHAKAQGELGETGNPNANGNALAHVAAIYLSHAGD